MLIKMLKSKIHRVTVTDKHLNYSGSIGIDADLLERCDLRKGECVLVVNVNNGSRHETYVQLAERGSGQIILNGAAARLGEIGDLVIIMGFGLCTPEEADGLEAKICLVDEKNAFTGYLK